MTTEIEMKTITPAELKRWQSEGVIYQLIDVREGYEVDEAHMGGIHIPMDEVIARVGEFKKDIPVVVHCKSGRRSEAVVHSLERKFAFSNLYTLEGGISAWLECQ